MGEWMDGYRTSRRLWWCKLGVIINRTGLIRSKMQPQPPIRGKRGRSVWAVASLVFFPHVQLHGQSDPRRQINTAISLLLYLYVSNIPPPSHLSKLRVRCGRQSSNWGYIAMLNQSLHNIVQINSKSAPAYPIHLLMSHSINLASYTRPSPSGG